MGVIVLPKQLVYALQNVTDIIVDIVGQDCKLYRFNSKVPDGIYDEGTIMYDAPIDTKVYIIWSKRDKKMKNGAYFVEGELPIRARLKFEDNVEIHSFIEFDYEIYFGKYHTHRLEIIDREIFGQDTEAKCIFLLAPMRGKSIPESTIPESATP